MSNDINTSKFYQFLANYKKSGENIADTIDSSSYGNSDGTLTKGEFRAFVNNEYNGWNGESKTESELNDLVNKFWRSIDKNTSSSKIGGTNIKNLNALDKNEEAAMEQKLELYVRFNQYTSKIKAPSVLTTMASAWKKAVIEELTPILEEFAKNGGSGDLEAALDAKFAEISNKQTAIFCAAEYQNKLSSSLLKDYPDYKIADDSTLAQLIENYVSTLNGDATPESIMEDMKKIVAAYLATANIGEGSDFDLSELGYSQKDSDRINDIQKEVIVKELLESLKSEKDYEKYKEYFTTALEKYASGLTLADFKNGNFVEEFKKTQDYQNILTIAWVNDTFAGEIKSDSPFYKALEGISKNLADKIANDARYISKYQEILNDVIEKVSTGELGKSDIQDYIIEQIKSNLEEFYPNGMKGMSLEEMEVVYKLLENAAASEKDTDKSWEAHRRAAIKYCDALSTKGESMQNAIAEIFGTSDYESAINAADMYPSEIKAKMAELIARAKEIGDIANMVAEWNMDNSYTMLVGGTLTLPLNANVHQKDDAKTKTQGKVTYQATSQAGATISIDGANKMTIKAPNASGVDTITITAYVDNIAVKPPITITVTYGTTADIVAGVTSWGKNSKSSHLETIGINQGEELTDSSFADLYNSDAIICLLYIDATQKKACWNGAYTTINERLNALGEHIKSALVAAGMDENKLSIAISNVTSKYMGNGSTSYNVSHRNTNIDSMFNKTLSTYRSNSSDTRHTIVEAQDYNGWLGSHIRMYSVSFKDLVDDIIEEYNKLMG